MLAFTKLDFKDFVYFNCVFFAQLTAQLALCETASGSNS